MTPPVEAAELSIKREKVVLRVTVWQVVLSKRVMGEVRRARPLA